jgi:outer membrane immunogenic protein
VFASGAFAAGAPAPYSWTGFYIGANVGALWSRDSVETTTGFDLAPPGTGYTLSPSGVLGGVQAGYNYQFSSFVLGVEGDFDGSSARASQSPVFGDSAMSHSTSLPSFADLRVRAGFAFDRFLPFVTGGVVVADIHNNLDIVDFTPSSIGREDATGWVIGGGGEYAIDNHWSVKADYLYMQFPDVTKTLNDGFPYQFKFKDSAQVARVGLNYRF